MKMRYLSFVELLGSSLGAGGKRDFRGVKGRPVITVLLIFSLLRAFLP
jgi:hypothetical protein